VYCGFFNVHKQAYTYSLTECQVSAGNSYNAFPTLHFTRQNWYLLTFSGLVKIRYYWQHGEDLENGGVWCIFKQFLLQ